MDPDDATSDTQASAEIDGIQVELSDWAAIDGVSFSATQLRDELVEGAVYYRGFHNPIDLETLTFSLDGNNLTVCMRGVVDFAFEGLSELGAVPVEWTATTEVEPDLWNAAIKRYLNL
ncbi:MAG: hypothetical protein AAFU85_09935 [Planctomycetota bacterium]